MAFLVRVVLRRAVHAVLLVWLSASTAFVLTHFAPGGYFDGFDVAPATTAAERRHYGLDQPLAVQYGRWLERAARLDFGESLKYRRPVPRLLRERVAASAVLGLTALLLATAVGLPLGTWTGARTRGAGPSAARLLSLAALSLHPLVLSFLLLAAAAALGWFRTPESAAAAASLTDRLRGLVLPALALAIPLAAAVERLQASAIRQALATPALLAARARGVPARTLLWRHAFVLALPPVAAVYGLIVGSVLSGSFIVEIVMSWPGLGALMYEGLLSRDLFLVAGCACAGAALLAAGVLASDLAVVLLDPRAAEHA
jgi:ABC-type dipeptide/oligopeptide/nickel transport system permease component